MAQARDVITPVQLAIIIISTIIGVDGFSMPRMVVEGAGRDGWLSILIGGIWMLIAATSLASLSSYFPRESPVAWLPKLIGKWPAKILLSIQMVFFLVMCAWSLRLFSDMMRVYLLPKTPTEVIMLTFLSIVVYLIVNGINPMTRISQLFFPFILIPFLSLGTVFKGTMDVGQIMPVLATGFTPVLKGLPPSIAVFVGWGVIGFLVQFLDDAKKAPIASGVGIGFLLVFFIWSFSLTLFHFGPTEMKHLLYPVIDYVREIEGKEGLIEKLDLFLLAFWIMTVFITVSFTYYIPVLISSEAFGFKGQETLVYLLLPLIFFISRLPRGIEATEVLGAWIGYLSITFSIITLFLFFLGWYKKRKGELANEQSS